MHIAFNGWFWDNPIPAAGNISGTYWRAAFARAENRLSLIVRMTCGPWTICRGCDVLLSERALTATWPKCGLSSGRFLRASPVLSQTWPCALLGSAAAIPAR